MCDGAAQRTHVGGTTEMSLGDDDAPTLLSIGFELHAPQALTSGSPMRPSQLKVRCSSSAVSVPLFFCLLILFFCLLPVFVCSLLKLAAEEIVGIGTAYADEVSPLCSAVMAMIFINALARARSGEHGVDAAAELHDLRPLDRNSSLLGAPPTPSADGAGVLLSTFDEEVEEDTSDPSDTSESMDDDVFDDVGSSRDTATTSTLDAMVSVLLFTVTFHANRAHNLTRSP